MKFHQIKIHDVFKVVSDPIDCFTMLEPRGFAFPVLNLETMIPIVLHSDMEVQLVGKLTVLNSIDKRRYLFYCCGCKEHYSAPATEAGYMKLLREQPDNPCPEKDCPGCVDFYKEDDKRYLTDDKL
jgi:hypothetical protein